MNDLLQSELFSLLTKSPPKVSNNKMKIAYGIFLKEVETLNQSDRDYQLIYRSLNLTRIEFQSLEAQIWYEQGKKCVEKSLFVESYLCN